MWLAILILAVCNVIVFFCGHSVGRVRERNQLQPALDDLRKVAKTRMEEIQSLEQIIEVRDDQLKDANAEYVKLKERCMKSEEFQDGVLELAGRLPVCDERLPALREILWNASRVGADEPVFTKKSDT